MRRFVVLSFVLPLAACPHPVVDVAIVGANVGLSTTDGAAWDGLGKVTPEARSALADAVESAGPLAIVGVDAVVGALDAVAPPDAYGTVSLVDAAGHVGPPVVLPAAPDTYTPRWSGFAPPTLHGVALDAAVSCRVALSDDDTLFDAPDPIATVDIGADDLRRALRAGEPVTVDFAEATGGQLLGVVVWVRKAAPPR
jgi:hypothetical protein